MVSFSGIRGERWLSSAEFFSEGEIDGIKGGISENDE